MNSGKNCNYESVTYFDGRCKAGIVHGGILHFGVFECIQTYLFWVYNGSVKAHQMFWIEPWNPSRNTWFFLFTLKRAVLEIILPQASNGKSFTRAYSVTYYEVSEFQEKISLCFQPLIRSFILVKFMWCPELSQGMYDQALFNTQILQPWYDFVLVLFNLCTFASEFLFCISQMFLSIWRIPSWICLRAMIH